MAIRWKNLHVLFKIGLINSITDTTAVHLFVIVMVKVIYTVREWVLTATDKHVPVLAPTGIAEVNINGMIFHCPLMLPMEFQKR